MPTSAQSPVVVIGGGFTGLSAAYDLAKRGLKVRVLEASSELGGLAGTFEIMPGVRLEKFYHHWFNSDRAALDLIDELGISPSLRFISSNTGLYYANSRFKLSSPLDLLKLTALPFIDRIRTGLMVLKARRIDEWKDLEHISAEEWVKQAGGNKAYEVMWKPLLQGKFGSEAPNVSAVWFWNKLKLRGGSRGKKGGEELVYLDGGFGKLLDGLVAAVKAAGGEVSLNSPVQKILVEDGVAKGVVANGEHIEARAVLATNSLPDFVSICPDLPASYRQQCQSIRYLGNVCLVLRLKQSLSSTYWLNVADPTFPFVGVIEHSNFDRPKGFPENEAIAFISKYLPTSDPLFKMSDQEYFEYCIPHIQRIFPQFSKDWVTGFSLWRANYSQPVIVQNYSSLIPAEKTPISKLWLCTMAQVYPEDRGTNYAIQYGRKVAQRMLQEIPAV